MTPVEGLTFAIVPALMQDGSQRECLHRQALALLHGLTGCHSQLSYRPSGAPYLPDADGLEVSISHCRAAVAAAAMKGRTVGVDVECRRHFSPTLVSRVCTPAEQRIVEQSADAQMAFLQLWTRKEAVLKCLGTGIRGFGSMQAALQRSDVAVYDVETALPDVVAAVAVKV